MTGRACAWGSERRITHALLLQSEKILGSQGMPHKKGNMWPHSWKCLGNHVSASVERRLKRQLEGVGTQCRLLRAHRRRFQSFERRRRYARRRR
ncbi:unnamed protein product [Ectocarpus sp. 8 AP-2014]